MPVVRSVIIVEDDPHYRDILVKYLSICGFDAVGVGCAAEFYREVHAKPYALAVLDLGLPDQSGLVLAEYLRKNTSLRVVILTARSGIDERVAGYAAGADLYMLKPVALEELSAALSSLCERYCSDGASSPEKGDVWHLITGQWLLIAPSGEQVQLSAKEFQFLACLAEKPKSIVSRESVQDVLGYEHSVHGYRAMEALVYRLRKKIPASFGEVVKTASATGYSFAYPIELS